MAQIWPKPSKQQQSWLLDKNSLTARLQSASAQFSLRVEQQYWCNVCHPNGLFTQMLGRQHAIRPAQRYWYRKVGLYLDNQLMISAFSYTPLLTQHRGAKFLTKLRKRSLGSMLFNDRRIQRGQILLHYDQRQQQWARASLFFIRQQPMLVCEYYHSNVYELPS